MRCQHLCLTTDNLAATRDFYVNLLGLTVTTYDVAVGLLALQLADGFVLRFEARGAATPLSMRFLGLELDSFENVDRLHDQLAQHIAIVQDLRPRFTTTAGPYGFLIDDPNGYRLKLFKYGPRSQQ